MKLIENKPNLTILTSKNPKMFFVDHGSHHPTIFQKKINSSYLSRATGPKLMILWLHKITEMRLGLVRIINIFLEVNDPS